MTREIDGSWIAGSEDVDFDAFVEAEEEEERWRLQHEGS
jgi:hypothetical protein